MAPYSVKLERFEGPLDLLLQLIEDEKLDVTELSLSTVAEQFLKHLKAVEERYPDELADFLVVATKLLVIKSRSLLPYLYPEAEEEGNLEDQLKMYRQFVEATKHIAARAAAARPLYGRQPMKLTDLEISFHPPVGVTAELLHGTFVHILKNLEPIIKLPQAALRKVVSLKEKIATIQEAILTQVRLSFSELLAGAKDRTDVIVTFLALLELVKQRTVAVHQADLYDDITIERVTNQS